MKQQLTGKTWWKPARTLALLAGVMALALALTAPVAWAGDKIKLDDGTELVGTIEVIGGGRFVKIKTDDGLVKMMPADKIASVNGDAYGASNAADAGPGDAGGSTANLGSGADRKEFERILDRAGRVREPVEAVTMWETFLNRPNLNEALTERANEELAVWKERYQDGCELIRGGWVGGDELTKMKEEADKLVTEAQRKEDTGNVLDAIRGYRDALSAYPNAFRPHFRMGYIAFHQGAGGAGRVDTTKLRQSERHVRQALKLQPTLPAVKSSAGAVLFALDKYEEGITLMWDAARKSESEMIVGNLLFALDVLPRRWLDTNADLRRIAIAAQPLRERYQSNGTLLYLNDFAYGTDDINPDDPDQKGPPGLRGNGSGFFISEDGYVLTNKHVAESDDGYYYRVRLSAKDDEGNFIEYPARFIASDDEFDVALLKVELPEGETTEFFHLLQEDVPPIQADVMTAGYPTVGTGNFVFQTARGTVSSNDTGDKEFDLYLDMKTTQGNSGGPIFDRNGHVIGITTAYRKVYDSIVSLAVGPRQIREFLGDVDEAPALEYDTESDRSFDPVELAEEVKDKTLLVLIFAGEAGDSGGGSSDEGDEGDEGEDEEPQDEGPAMPQGPGGSQPQLE